MGDSRGASRNNTATNPAQGYSREGTATSGVADEGIEMQSDWSSVRSITGESVCADTDKDREDDKLDENGNPTSHNNVFPIMEPNYRPFSIYRHTPVFHSKKLQVPSLPQTQQMEPSINQTNCQEKQTKSEKSRKQRRKKDEERNVKKSEDIEGFRGNDDMDSILQFLGEDADNSSRKNRKSQDKTTDKLEKDKTKKN